MLWRYLLASTVILAACPPKAGPVAVDLPPRATAPTGPRVTPRILFDAEAIALTFEGLPAVSADGRFVALAVVLEDGARAAPNGALRVVEVDTGAASDAPILGLEEGAASDDEGVRRRLVSRVPDRVAAALPLLQGRTWHALDGMQAGPPDEDLPGVTRGLSFGDLTITFSAPRLRIARGARGVFERDFPEWSAPRALRYEDCDAAKDPTCVCDNPAFLRAGWVDLPTRALLLRVGYVGDDTCWEPESRLHIMRLPP